jgi:5-(carboxyamino)imidazole ribonucleotide synthase
MLPPGKTLGWLGDGLHGRLFASAAIRLGYRVQIFNTSDSQDTTRSPDALADFGRTCDVVTWGGADLPLAALRAVGDHAPVHPSGTVREICQGSAPEKEWLQANGFPVANEDEEVTAAMEVMLARSAKAAIRVDPPVEILATDRRWDLCVAPARMAPEVTAAAEKLARLIAEKLGLVGVMGVEMDVTRAGRVLVRKLVPGTHNSGHWTLDACMTSQFEQQVRAICGLPLGAVTQLSTVVMVNIPGELWAKGEPNWDVLLAQPNVRLHLYGQNEPPADRQMGHFTVMARDADLALELARKYQARLG